MEQVKDGYDFDYYLIPSKNYKVQDDDEMPVFVQQEDIVIKKVYCHTILFFTDYIIIYHLIINVITL